LEIGFVSNKVAERIRNMGMKHGHIKKMISFIVGVNNKKYGHETWSHKKMISFIVGVNNKKSVTSFLYL